MASADKDLINEAVRLRIAELQQRFPTLIDAQFADEIHEILRRALKDNPELRKNSASELAKLYSAKLFSAAWKTETDRANQRKLYEHGQELELKKENGELCPNCGKNLAKMTAMQQLRGSDEPMTQFWQCFGCNQKWTIE